MNHSPQVDCGFSLSSGKRKRRIKIMKILLILSKKLERKAVSYYPITAFQHHSILASQRISA